MKEAIIKYTTDGRKVVVIGDLNQTEKIVQEIFITEDGAEIPSGERFVVKSLLDAPAKSWKESKLIELEAQFEKERESWERRIKAVHDEKEIVYKSLSVHVKWLKQVAKQSHPESLKDVITTLYMFLSNTDMWVFYADYSNWYLEKYDQEGFSRIHDYVGHDYNSAKLKGMKLVSLFGNTDGNLQFKISEYSDGSGSNKDVEYFKSKEDALIYMQNRFNDVKIYNQWHLDVADKYQLQIDNTKLTTLKDSQKKSVLNRMDELSKELTDCENKLNEL